MTIKVVIVVSAGIVYAGVALTTFAMLPGTLLALAAFHITMAAMIYLIFIGPFSYAYGFWATLIFLGFWPKLVAHLLFGLEFVEPVGAFDRTANQWNTALLATAAAAIGVILIRLSQLMILRRQRYPMAYDSYAGTFPEFYRKYCRWIWLATLVAIFSLSVWNFSAAFYQIGVNPRLILPARMNIGMSWLLNWGFAMWIACLVHWELRLRPSAGPGLLLAIVAEALIASVSTLSRSAYLLHALPGLLAWRLSHCHRKALRSSIILALIFVTGLGASLATVQFARSQSYFTPGVSASPTLTTPEPQASQQPPGMFTQIAFLFLHRWVGLEGMLAVTAYPGKGPALLQEALLENPKLGVNTIFQQIAKSSYSELQDFTFLTLAGTAAFLFYSGSKFLVAAGMAFLTLVLLATETAIRKTTGNLYLAAVAAAAMAYTTVQLNFPYLTLIFFLQLWVTIVAIALLEYISTRQSQVL